MKNIHTYITEASKTNKPINVLNDFLQPLAFLSQNICDELNDKPLISDCKITGHNNYTNVDITTEFSLGWICGLLIEQTFVDCLKHFKEHILDLDNIKAGKYNVSASSKMLQTEIESAADGTPIYDVKYMYKEQHYNMQIKAIKSDNINRTLNGKIREENDIAVIIIYSIKDKTNIHINEIHICVPKTSSGKNDWSDFEQEYEKLGVKLKLNPTMAEIVISNK